MSEKESPPTVFVRDLKPKMTNWKIKFLVLEKSHAKEARRTPTKYQTLTLADSRGDQIEAVIFGDGIQLLQHTLIPLQKYYIGNAQVKESLPQYRSPATDCNLQITPRTVIQQCFDDSNIPDEIYNFTPFTDFHLLVDSETSIDVVGLVLALNEPEEKNFNSKPSRVQEIIIIDEKLMPISLSLWDDFIDNEGEQIAAAHASSNQFATIIARKVKVTSYTGMSLSTKPISTFMVDVRTGRTDALLNWSLENLSMIDAAYETFKAVPWQKRIPNFSIQIATPLSNVPIKAEKVKNIWVFAASKITSTRQNFYYIGCNLCHAATDAECDTEYECNRCHKNTTAKPRVYLEFQLSDETGHQTVVIEGDLAEEHFGCKASILMEKLIQGTSINKEIINLEEIGPRLMRLKASDPPIKNENITYKKEAAAKKKYKVKYIQLATIEAAESSQQPALSIEPGPGNAVSSTKSASGTKRKLILEETPAENINAIIKTEKEITPSPKATVETTKPTQQPPLAIEPAPGIALSSAKSTSETNKKLILGKTPAESTPSPKKQGKISSSTETHAANTKGSSL